MGRKSDVETLAALEAKKKELDEKIKEKKSAIQEKIRAEQSRKRAAEKRKLDHVKYLLGGWFVSDSVNQFLSLLIEDNKVNHRDITDSVIIEGINKRFNELNKIFTEKDLQDIKDVFVMRLKTKWLEYASGSGESVSSSHEK